MDNKLRISITLLRIGLGALFLWAGVDKLLNDFSAEGYLTNATSGPFAGIFEPLAGSSVVDSLVIWGEIGIGVALLFGVATRFGSVCGVIMMSLFYLSDTAFENGPITQHIIYILAFLVFIFSGAGRILGLDGILERQDFFKRNYRFFKYLLG